MDIRIIVVDDEQDFLDNIKPFGPDEIEMAIDQALEKQQLL